MTTTIGSLDLNAFSDLYSDSTQYFWFESNASATYGAGAHVTLVPDTSFISNPTGQNILMNTDGFSIRNGLLPMMTLDNDSLDFNFVDTTAGTYTTMATFGLSGMQIYSRDSDNNLVQLANIGYGEGQSQSGTTIAPYYTFGERQTTTTAYNSSSTYVIGDTCVYDGKVYVCVYDIATPELWDADHWRYYIGNYSVAEGRETTASGSSSHAEGRATTATGVSSHAEGYITIASGLGSHAEGYGTTASAYAHAEGRETTASGSSSHAEGRVTTASGGFSHAEGNETTASGSGSHAEGYATIASGYCSHVEGYGTTASGWYSHVQNYYTISQRKSQTAIGEYNIADTGGTDTTTRGNYAFIIGNGTADDARSNALTVDWNGKIQTSQMQAGTISATSVSANSYTDVYVPFASTMSGVPIVVCSVVSTSTAGAIGSITSAVTSTSTTGFTCRIFNAGSTARTPAVNWIALNV